MPRIVAVAVLPLNRAALAVDDELGSLVATDFPASVYCFRFRVKVTASSFGPGTLHVPPAIWIRHYMVTVTHYGRSHAGLGAFGRGLLGLPPRDKPLDSLRPDTPRQGPATRSGSRVRSGSEISAGCTPGIITLLVSAVVFGGL